MPTQWHFSNLSTIFSTAVENPQRKRLYFGKTPLYCSGLFKILFKN